MKITPLSLLAGAALTVFGTLAAAQTAEREIFVEQGQRSTSQNATKHEKSAKPLRQDGQRTTPPRDQVSVQAINQDFWIYSALTEIQFDDDRDGFFTRLILDFDADTIFSSADVYAVLYLSLEGGPWNELTVTDVFTIFGAGAGDEYFVDTDLISGYPTGSYDLLIELYDTFDGRLVAEFGPNDSLDLFDLPLEDQTRDEVIIVGGGQVIAVTEGGGGALGGLGLLALTALLIARRRYQHSKQ
ncbi:MAG: choice-of-anchor H family protein [Pseudomonadota bacterium]